MVVHAMHGFPPINVVFQPFAVVSFVGRSIFNLGGFNRDLGVEARAGFVSYDHDQVGVWDHVDTERPFAVGRMTKRQFSLDWHGFAIPVESLFVQFV